jgi:hypothetical protein
MGVNLDTTTVENKEVVGGDFQTTEHRALAMLATGNDKTIMNAHEDVHRELMGPRPQLRPTQTRVSNRIALADDEPAARRGARKRRVASTELADPGTGRVLETPPSSEESQD